MGGLSCWLSLGFDNLVLALVQQTRIWALDLDLDQAEHLNAFGLEQTKLNAFSLKSAFKGPKSVHHHYK